MICHTKNLTRLLWVLRMQVFALIIFCTSANAQTQRIDVLSPRPLSDATLILQGVLNQPITYEDPQWDNPNETKELFKHGPVIPKSHRLKFRYTLGDPRMIITQLLHQYHQQIGRAQFKLIIDPEGIFNVVPIRRSGRDSRLTSNVSILSTKISLYAEDKSYASIMETIEELLSPNFAGLALHFQPLYRLKKSVNWSNNEARSCINELFSEINRQRAGFRYSWELRYAPDFPQGVLSVRRIFPNMDVFNSAHMRIETARPLVEALKMLETDFGQTITYEGPPLLCPCDVMSDRSGTPQRPRGGIIAFSYSLQAQPSQVIQACLKAYHSNLSKTGNFQMIKTSSIYHVLPTEFRNEQGILIPHESILRAPITVIENNRSPMELLRIICRKLTESSGKSVIVGEFGARELSILQQAPLKSLNLVGQSPRMILTELVKDIHYNLSWHVFFDPESKEYVLNIHTISTSNH